MELVNTLAAFGTFVVIATTAIAAIVQLRHSRTSNQILALNEIRETLESAGLIGRSSALDLWSGVVIKAWDTLAPFAAIRRRQSVSSNLWENFEYLTVLAQD